MKKQKRLREVLVFQHGSLSQTHKQIGDNNIQRKFPIEKYRRFKNPN